MFIAALWSRLCVVPQPLHVQLLSASVRSSFMRPQTLQVLLDGYHLSILAKVFPCDVSLYSSIVRNMPKPLSLVDLPSFREPAIPRRFISSTTRHHTAWLSQYSAYGRSSFSGWLYALVEGEPYAVAGYSCWNQTSYETAYAVLLQV